MDRQIIYPGQLLPETTLLQMTKDSMIGAAKLASALLGTSTMASGFAVTPTGPASLQVLCAPGEIYSLTTIDALAFSTLPADTTHSILKQGILLDGVTLSCPAPGTTGQSINYLVQVTYQDSDATPVLLPYYNSANPALPYSGMGNNGLTQNTVRKGSAVVAVKAGASATTGSQVTPSPDAGYIGLYVVTVAFGQTTIVSGNIAVASNAPFINSTLHGLSPVFTVSPSVPTATLGQHAMPLGQATGRLLRTTIYAIVSGSQQVSVDGGAFTTVGATTFTPLALTTAVEVESQGGGGGGGGVAATGAGQVSAAFGGQAGTYGYGRFTSAFSGITITVGTKGLGGAAGANTGGNGNASSFGGLLSCGGGVGGVGGTANTAGNSFGLPGPVSGAPSGANVKQVRGQGAGAPSVFSTGQSISGAGGASFFGAGGQSFSGGVGINATNPGSGGSGAAVGQSSGSSYKGGDGMDGIVIVREFA